MSSVEQEVSTLPLADRDIWIIDDAFPVVDLPLPHDDISNGRRPIDHGTLLALLRLVGWENWDDKGLYSLCEKLTNSSRSVTAFLSPTAAIQHLEQGAPVPDIIVYDWEYRFEPSTPPQDQLRELLNHCVAVVQVYTNRDASLVQQELAAFPVHLRGRLEEAKSKMGTDLDDLTQAMAARFDSSLSTRLARDLRRSTAVAVESLLVRLDCLPLKAVMTMLAGSAESPEDLELLEFLSVKIGESLESSPKLVGLLMNWLKQNGLTETRAEQIVSEVVTLLSAEVRNEVQYSGALLRNIQAAWQKVPPAAPIDPAQDRVSLLMKDLFAFRMYDQPKDDLVRTGDIVLLLNGSVAPEHPDLLMILTPLCDLHAFWKKTRGCLTTVRLHPMDTEDGKARIACYGNSAKESYSSVTNRHPFKLPSIPIKSDTVVDYAMYVHELMTIEAEDKELFATKEQKSRAQRPLTYSRLSELLAARGLAIQRICRVSHPFLNGILSEISNILFRSGVPDFPK